jgi:hypothetical protein
MPSIPPPPPPLAPAVRPRPTLPPFDIAVLVRTLLRPSLATALRSIYGQRFAGRIQILIGIDAMDGGESRLAELRAECPPRMRLDVIDLGYATSQRRGGLYPCAEGGILATLLVYAAQARHVIFLDDDNWMAPDHLQSLRDAIEGFDWAFSLRWFVDAASRQPLCVDRWESVGPGRGVYARKAGGFVDPNCLLFDKLPCHAAVPWLAQALYANGSGHDRLFFDQLRQRHSVAWTGRATLFYQMHANDPLHPLRRQ